MPDPFNIKKKTVRMPPLELMASASPMEQFLVEVHRDAQEDRNTLVAAQQWQNRMIWERLKAGEELLKYVKIIAFFAKWSTLLLGPPLVIFVGESAVSVFNHLMGFK